MTAQKRPRVEPRNDAFDALPDEMLWEIGRHLERPGSLHAFCEDEDRALLGATCTRWRRILNPRSTYQQDWTPFACQEPVSRTLFQWLWSMGAICKDLGMHLLARAGRLDDLIWARAHGGEWDEWTCAFAAAGQALVCLAYLHEHGCPWQVETLYAAFEPEGERPCFRYAHDHGCPCYYCNNTRTTDVCAAWSFTSWTYHWEDRRADRLISAWAMGSRKPPSSS